MFSVLKIGLLMCCLTCLVEVSTSQCNGESQIIQQNYGFIRSPNLGAEYGKSADCSWTFDRRNRPFRALILNVVKLRLFETNFVSRYCSDDYNFSINGERYGCNPVLFVKQRQPRSCLAYFSNPRCRNTKEVKICAKRQETYYDVNVTYISNGAKKSDDESIMGGFMVEYKFIPCNRPGQTATTSPRKTPVYTKRATTPRLKPSTLPPQNPLNSTPWNSPTGRMMTLQDSFDEGSRCVFRSVTCDVAMAMIAALAGVLGFALGAGCLLIIVKRRDKSKVSDLPEVSGWSITRSVTTVSECAEMRKRTSTDHVYIEANRPSLFEGQYEVPLPKGHYEEPMPSKNCKQSVSNDYEMMG